MSILLISPSFHGHAGAIRKLQNMIDMEVSDNIKTILKITDSSKNTTTNPKEFVFENCVDNVNSMLPILDQENVILIIYDFFSIEGSILAKKNNIPCICSIPATISESINYPFKDQLVLEKMNMLEQHFDIRLPIPK